METKEAITELIQKEKKAIDSTQLIFEAGIESLLSKGRLSIKELKVAERIFNQVMDDNFDYLCRNQSDYVAIYLEEEFIDLINKTEGDENNTATN
jgi:hypothetical protein